MNVLKKELKIGKNFIILLLIINFLVLGFYYTYAIFVTKQLQENVAVLVTSDIGINITSNDLVDNKVLVKANETKNIIINLTNTTSSKMYYILLHEKVPTGVMVYETNNDNTTLGVIEGNKSVMVSVTIKNDTDNDVSVEFYSQGSREEIVDKDMGYSFINQVPNYDHSGANEPVLDNLNAIPIYYEATSKTSGVWKKADSLNVDSGGIWYDYDNGRWANIALVSDYNRDTYLYSDVGTVIDDNDILAYFVWIPSFRYSIINNNNPTNYERDINVIFENGIGKMGTVTCVDDIASVSSRHVYSEVCTDEINSKIYENLSTYSHPAFDDNATGFWVGKFQTSSNGTKIVPNTPATMSTLDKAFEVSRNYESDMNPYGIINNNLDTSLLTNMEWGAITILSSSLYGKSGNEMYFNEDNYSFKRIYVNANNNSYYTGCSSNYSINSNSFITSDTASCVKYNDLNDYTHTSNSILYPIGEVGPGASTTGTIYGVYDMAGAYREMVAGIVLDETYTLDKKYNNEYYDLYSTNTYIGTINDSSNIRELFRYKLGDGVREHYRTFSENGLWHGGYLKQSNVGGVIVRGGDSNSGRGASIFSSDIIPLTESSAYRVTINMKEEI